jgi:serine protease AprX
MPKAFIYIDSTDEEAQAAVAAGVTEVIAVYGVRVLVLATDEELAALEAAGRRVEMANEMDSFPFPSAPDTTETTSEAITKGARKGASKAKRTRGRPKKQAAARSAAASGGTSDQEEMVYWLVQFVGPPLPEWVDEVRTAGAEVVGPVPPNLILARMTTAQADAVRVLDRVQRVELYRPEHKVHLDLSSPPEPQADTQARRETSRALSAEAEGPASAESVAVTIVLFDANALSSVVAEIETRGGIVHQADIDTIIADIPPALIPDIAAVPVVARIYPYVPPALTMSQARIITRIHAVFETHGRLDGEGEIVCIADSGLDVGPTGMLHSDFLQLEGPGASRVINAYAPQQVNPGLLPANQRPPIPPVGPPPPGPPLWDDPQGHGTHVAGIAVGNGRMSGAGRPESGVAFKAQIVMQSMQDFTGGLGGIPANLNTLFGPVYTTDEARIHNNSWGSPGNFAQYQARAHQTDEFVWRNPDMVIVFAAGNEGTDGPRVGPPPVAAVPPPPPPPPPPPVDPLGPGAADGIVDFGSISPQATCRNGITVGGSENTRPAIATRWNAMLSRSMANFPVAFALSTDKVADNDQHLMAISGRGPTVIPAVPGPFQGDRIKPDVVAPGSSIHSCRSSVPGAWVNPTGWGNSTIPLRYLYLGGTSMATPHVSGMCALIRQYLRKIHHHSDPSNPDPRRRRPSAALIKALLVHGARTLITVAGQNAANAGTVPGNHQGWGRVDLRRTLFSMLKSSMVDANDNGWLPRRTIFLDSPGLTIGPTPSHHHHEVRVTVADNSIPLRATLVWTDYPGVAGHNGSLINKLSLSIRRVDGGPETPFALPVGIAPAGLLPLSNNVQQVDLSAPTLMTGRDYVIKVSDANGIPSVATAGVRQDFALVISGAISHSNHRSVLNSAPSVMAALPDLAFVDLQRAAGQDLHDGLAPSVAPPPGNTGSPDIWVSRDQNPAAASAVDHLELGQTHYVHVRVRNLGFVQANGSQINLYWANPTSAMAYPADWKTEGFRVDGVDGNQRTVNVPARTKPPAGWQDGEFIALPFEWQLPRNLERVALLVRAVHPDDPIVNEGDVRWDNNIARRDYLIQDNTTQVQGTPTQQERAIFLTNQGVPPRDIELRVAFAYQDIRDGQIKPLPPGVVVEVWDYDPGPRDQKLAQGRTAISVNAAGQPASVVHLNFSTHGSTERDPDLYLKVLKPAEFELEEFANNSFFATGAAEWSSFDRTTQRAIPDGFYQENFTGPNIGVGAPVQLTIRPAGMPVRVAFEYFSGSSSQFEKLPRGVEVKVRDSNPTARQPLLATARTDANGEIVTILPRPAGSHPGIYFEIDGTGSNQGRVVTIDFFQSQHLWDSRTHRGEDVAANGTVSAISGHFQNWTQPSLVAADHRLRFRLEAPGILMHLRFQYWDREVTPPAYVDLPPGIEVEVWEDVAAPVSPLVTGTVGQNGRLELSVPKGGRPQLDLFARVVMRRRLTGDPDIPPTAEVRKAGNIVHWDTNTAGRTAVGGESGAFHAVVDHVASAATPLVFRIGADGDSGRLADNTDVNAAPFILKVVGEVHDWFRTRMGSEWPGIFNLRVELFEALNAAAPEGSRSTSNTNTIHLNTAHSIDPPVLPVSTLDHRNRAVIAHHYGHLVLDSFLLNPLMPARVIPRLANHHDYNSGVERGTQRRLVFAEGWADYIASRHVSTPVAPDPASPPIAWRGLDVNGADNSGEVVPVAVANTLWQLDHRVVGQGNNNNINNPVNKRRFRALIINAIKSLARENDNRHVAFHLYRAIQTASLNPEDVILPHDITFIRQQVRQIFEENGMVFTRGRITAGPLTIPGPATPVRRRFQVAPVVQAKLNIAEMGRITFYKLQAVPAAPAGNWNFIDLLPVVRVTHANQHETIDVSLTAARQSGALPAGGAHNIRVVACDEFGAWDTFKDDLTNNTPETTHVTDNLTWQRTRLHSIAAGTVPVPP